MMSMDIFIGPCMVLQSQSGIVNDQCGSFSNQLKNVSGFISSKDVFPEPRLYGLSQGHIIQAKVISTELSLHYRPICTTKLTSLSDPESDPKPNPHLGLLSRHQSDPARAIVRFGG